MSEQQTLLNAKAELIVSSFNLIKILINAIIYSVVLFLGFLVLKIDPDWITIIIVFIMLLLYFFAKDFMLYRQAKKAIKSQYDYLISKHPNISLYIPIIGKNGLMLYMKKAALFIDDDNLFLEAFDQQAFKQTPTKSISMPHGEDFIIKALQPDKRKPYYVVTSSIKEHDYEFIIPSDQFVIDYINSKISILDKEVA